MHWLPWYAYPAACCFLAGGACGWFIGYAHREFVEWGRRLGRLAGWWQRYRWRPLARLGGVYRELWRGTLVLALRGAEAVGRVNARAVGR